MENDVLFELQRKNIFIAARQYIENVIKEKREIDRLEEVEFQVFSQFGEDGIIQWIINQMEIRNRIFVEFGVEDYFESNTRFLLHNNNWTGVVLDGDKTNIKRILNSRYYWRYDLTAIAAFITTDNINDLIKSSGISGEIGILSVDLDGNDYWILQAISAVNPQIIICEYNNLFGPIERVSIPYDEGFKRTDAHYSNLYFGASLNSFRYLLEPKGYIYLGSNSAGNNAFFAKKTDFPLERVPHHNEDFVISKFRESRNKNGKLNYLNRSDSLIEIGNLELVRVDTMDKVTVSELNGKDLR